MQTRKDIRPKLALCKTCSCRKEYHVGYCAMCGEEVCSVFVPACADDIRENRANKAQRRSET